jgi:hypothetical protein
MVMAFYILTKLLPNSGFLSVGFRVRALNKYSTIYFGFQKLYMAKDFDKRRRNIKEILVRNPKKQKVMAKYVFNFLLDCNGWLAIVGIYMIFSFYDAQ